MHAIQRVGVGGGGACPWELGNALCKRSGIRMVLVKALGHLVQRYQACAYTGAFRCCMSSDNHAIERIDTYKCSDAAKGQHNLMLVGAPPQACMLPSSAA